MSQAEVLSDVETALMQSREFVMAAKANLSHIKQVSPQAFHRLLPGFLEIAGRQAMLEGTVRGAIQENGELGVIPLVTLGVLGISSALTALLGRQVIGAKEQVRVTGCIGTQLTAGKSLPEAERICNPTTVASAGGTRPLFGINIPSVGLIAVAVVGFFWFFGPPRARAR